MALDTMAEAEKDEIATPFVLKATGHGFEGRLGNIFGGLDALEQNHISHERNRTDLEEFANLKPRDEDDILNHSSCVSKLTDDLQKCTEREQNKQRKNIDDSGYYRKSDCSEDNRDREETARGADRGKASIEEEESEGRESQFRKPSGRAPGRQPRHRSPVPDHGKGSKNWAHYTLEDVNRSDMSDKANTQAALAFLDERRKLREEKEREEMGMEPEPAFDAENAACSKGLFSFSKRKKTDKTDSESDSSTADVIKPTDSVVGLPLSDDGGMLEGGELEEATVTKTSTAEGDSSKPAFKNRKGIKRNIRSRDDD